MSDKRAESLIHATNLGLDIEHIDLEESKEVQKKLLTETEAIESNAYTTCWDAASPAQRPSCKQ